MTGPVTSGAQLQPPFCRLFSDALHSASLRLTHWRLSPGRCRSCAGVKARELGTGHTRHETGCARTVTIYILCLLTCTFLLILFFHVSNTFISLVVTSLETLVMEDWEEDIEDLKFEEVDDDFEEALKADNTAEACLEPTKEEPFTQFYNPIRAAFADDNTLLEKFSLCQSHAQRLEILLGLEIVRSSLAGIKSGEAVTGEAVPVKPESEPKPWKTPPKLSYGSHKKYPHLSKALEVCLRSYTLDPGYF